MDKTAWLVVFLLVYWGYFLFRGVNNRCRDAGSYFRAGRRSSVWIYVFGATVTTLSGWILLGHPGQFYLDGFPYGHIGIAAIVIPLTGILFLKRQWLLGRRFGFVTPGEMLAAHFGSDAIRPLVLLIGLMVSIPFIALQLRAAGLLVGTVTDGAIPGWAGMIVLAAGALVFTLMGGIRSVAYLDALLVIILVAGVAVLGVVILEAVGGWDHFRVGLTRLTELDPARTVEGFSHFVAVGTVFGPVEELADPRHEGWTGAMILTFTLAFMGLQAAPGFSVWALANPSPRPFAGQQLVGSAIGLGVLLMICAPLIGVGGRLLGGDPGFYDAAPEVVHNVMGGRLGGLDLAAAPGGADALFPHLLALLGRTLPWFVGLLSAALLAAMQAAVSAHLATTGAMLTRDISRQFPQSDILSLFPRLLGQVGLFAVMLAALLVAATTDASLMTLAASAGAFGLQMVPALVAVCWLPFLSGGGIIAGMIFGVGTLLLTEIGGPEGLGLTEWGRWPLSIHSGIWGLAANFSVVLLLSALPWGGAERARRRVRHAALTAQIAVAKRRRWLVPLGWLAPPLWLFFAIGPGAVVGDVLFGNPNDPASWLYGIPSIWSWQLAAWGAGILLIWFLAYLLGLSTLAGVAEESLPEDPREIHLDLDRP